MWLWDWFWRGLRDLGLYQKKAKLVFLGLDNAGKTTLMNLLVSGELCARMPTQKPTTEEFQQNGIHFVTHDLGGHEVARRIWTEYGAEADGIIFLIDSWEVERLEEAHQELEKICREESMSHLPLLILGNKIDLVGSLSYEELYQFIGISRIQQQNNRVALFMCSLVKKQGYKEGIQWLSQNLSDC